MARIAITKMALATPLATVTDRSNHYRSNRLQPTLNPELHLATCYPTLSDLGAY